MTLDSSSSMSITRKNRQDVIRTIQEITHFDEMTINRAIEACQDNEGRYSMDQVLNVLMDDKYSNDNDSISSPSNKQMQLPTTPSKQTPLVDKPIDKPPPTYYNAKTYNDSDYMTMNEEDDSCLNESDLIRSEERPVGLRNVGNTCWFNSIIQAFFHLPYFRNLVLSYQINALDLEKLNENAKNIVQFVLELRKLFALMLKSRRKAINPNASLKYLRQCSKYTVNFNQEDVSEFSTTLVNLIEESFDIISKLAEQQQSSLTTIISNSESNTACDDVQNTRKNRKNPIVNLLNGDLKLSRTLANGTCTERIEIFREVNIQMLNSRNLHEGLELEWGETSIDLTKNTNESFCEQESWIMQLPSVLFICLNRYKFSKLTQSSSKIIEPFEFYQSFWLDRYMHENQEIIRAKRKELKVYNEHLEELEKKLKVIKDHNFGETHYALDDIFRCALNFASNNQNDEIFAELTPKPSNSETSEEESLNGLRKCLKSWIEHIESKIQKFQDEIKQVRDKIDKIYDEESLKKVQYNLHSVCIHEGSATYGHFWTYIWNQDEQKWFKFNDSEVSESNWDDLYSNARGSSSGSNISDRAPSAYYLIYVKADDTSIFQSEIQLASDLEKLVNNDQDLILQQMSQVKLKQMLKRLHDKQKLINIINPNMNDNQQTLNEHAKAFSDITMDVFQKYFDRVLDTDAEQIIHQMVDTQISKYNETSLDVRAKLSGCDLRLNHILTYLSSNQIQRDVKELALVDLYRQQIFNDSSDLRLKIIQAAAQLKYMELTNDSNKLDLFKIYEKLQNDYKDYRSIIAAFLNAFTLMEQEKYEEALPFYCVSCEFNERLTQQLKQRMKGMDHDVLLKMRQKCLKLWNQAIMRRVVKSDTSEINKYIDLMMNKFIPCLNRLASSTTEDKVFMEEIRQEWLTILDSNLSDLQIFQDFMGKLFEEPYGNHCHQLSVNKTNLFERYKETLFSIKSMLSTTSVTCITVAKQ